jgi:hypothetical protein
MTNSIRDSLQKALSNDPQFKIISSPPKLPHTFLRVHMEEENSITFLAVEPENLPLKFKDPWLLFIELRNGLRAITKDPRWGIRFASQIHGMNLPFLHHQPSSHIYIDPMLPYRSPKFLLANGESLTLFKMPSYPYYMKSKEEVLKIEQFRKKFKSSTKSQTTSHEPTAGSQ